MNNNNYSSPPENFSQNNLLASEEVKRLKYADRFRMMSIPGAMEEFKELLDVHGEC